MDLLTLADDLTAEVRGLSFSEPITHVYNPLEYARQSYAQYIRRYGCASKEVVLLGMNPGPWGMVQTGIPFGEVGAVRDWLGISASVGAPPRQHPKRPVLGFSCGRSEVSGRRVWGWATETFGTPDRFFSSFFIANYCPLAFFDEDGKNRTPDKIRRRERIPLLALCDHALVQTVDYLQPNYVIGFGRFAEERARIALSDMNVTVSAVPHPSPANPQAKRGWKQLVYRELTSLGITL